MPNHKIFSTSDLALATAIALHTPIVSIDKSDIRKAIFVFTSSDKVEKVVDSFWKGDLRVDPKSYFAMLRELKARIYEPE